MSHDPRVCFALHGGLRFVSRLHDRCLCGGLKRRTSVACRGCPGNGGRCARTCAVCQKTFTVKRCVVRRGGGRFCGRSCARSGSPARSRRRIQRRCPGCRRLVQRRPCELGKSGKLFCTRACWYRFNRKTRHVGWKGGQKSERWSRESYHWRRAVLHRDRNRCRLCGDTSRLEVNHIKVFSKFPELRWVVANGITLCHACHVSIRGKEEAMESKFIALLRKW